MPAFTTADDEIVQAAAAVLEGDRPDGTDGIRRVDRGDDAFVYRVDPDADADPPVDPDDVTADGEIPGADAVLWRADGGDVESELERRALDRP